MLRAKVPILATMFDRRKSGLTSLFAHPSVLFLDLSLSRLLQTRTRLKLGVIGA